jgi:hypothetical protein
MTPGAVCRCGAGVFALSLLFAAVPLLLRSGGGSERSVHTSWLFSCPDLPSDFVLLIVFFDRGDGVDLRLLLLLCDSPSIWPDSCKTSSLAEVELLFPSSRVASWISDKGSAGGDGEVLLAMVVPRLLRCLASIAFILTPNCRYSLAAYQALRAVTNVPSIHMKT